MCGGWLVVVVVVSAGGEASKRMRICMPGAGNCGSQHGRSTCRALRVLGLVSLSRACRGLPSSALPCLPADPLRPACPPACLVQEDEQYREGKLRFTGGRGEQATYGAGDEEDAAIQQEIEREARRRHAGSDDEGGLACCWWWWCSWWWWWWWWCCCCGVCVKGPMCGGRESLAACLPAALPKRRSSRPACAASPPLRRQMGIRPVPCMPPPRCRRRCVGRRRGGGRGLARAWRQAARARRGPGVGARGGRRQAGMRGIHHGTA